MHVVVVADALVRARRQKGAALVSGTPATPPPALDTREVENR